MDVCPPALLGEFGPWPPGLIGGSTLFSTSSILCPKENVPLFHRPTVKSQNKCIGELY